MTSNKTKFQFINDLSIKLSRYEALRKEYIQKLVKYEIITFIIAIISGYITYLFRLNLYLLCYIVVPLIVVLLLCLVLLVGFPSYFNKGLRSEMKDCYRKEFEDSFCVNMRGVVIDSEMLVKSDLFSDFNVFNYDDVIQGTYNGVTYRITEAILKLKDSKNGFSFPVFSGVVIDIPLNKAVNGKTIIISKSDKNKMKSLPFSFLVFAALIVLVPSFVLILQRSDLSQILISILIMLLLVIILIAAHNYTSPNYVNKYSHAKLEDIVFEKKFMVQSEDQVECRYLVTPAFMDRLKGIQTSFGTKNIKCSFVDNKILIAIETSKDLFEICDLFRKMGDTRRIANFYDEIVSIQNLIDYFKLDEKTGL